MENAAVYHALMECTNYHIEKPHANRTCMEVKKLSITNHSLKSILRVDHCETTKTVIYLFFDIAGLYVRI